MTAEIKTIPVLWKDCNCSGVVIRPGILRTLMEMLDPRVSQRLDSQPCSHWQEGQAYFYLKKKVRT